MGGRSAVHRPCRAETRRAPWPGAVSGEEGEETSRRGARPHGTDEELHKARKAGKRARYAAELAHPVLGKQTKNAIDQYKELQDILGDLQDGVVAADLLRRIAAGTAGRADENGFTYGLLYAQEQSRAQDSRQRAVAWVDKRCRFRPVADRRSRLGQEFRPVELSRAVFAVLHSVRRPSWD